MTITLVRFSVISLHSPPYLIAYAGISHSVVTYPASTEDVVTIVQIANKYRMPITPYSGGTALEGHTTGYKGGGICVDVSVNMNRILEVHGMPNVSSAAHRRSSWIS